MKVYPSIPGPKEAPQLPCTAFYKYDGSNLRFEWSRKKGWYKFGTRSRLFDQTDPDFGPAIPLFFKKYAEAIQRIFYTQRQFSGVREVVCYCEFFGPYSFAGHHNPNDPVLEVNHITHNNPKDLVLFDVNLHRKGFMSPKSFLDTFGHLHVPPVLYKGDLTPDFINEVKQGKLPVWEGVVCKGGEGHRLWMRKIKTQAYLDELKRRFPSNWEQYGE